jgi:hypothetical protein
MLGLRHGVVAVLAVVLALASGGCGSSGSGRGDARPGLDGVGGDIGPNTDTAAGQDTTSRPDGTPDLDTVPGDASQPVDTAQAADTVVAQDSLQYDQISADTCGMVVFFNPSQTAKQVASGTTTDTIESNGYRFKYTRDKLFTGGVGMTDPIGRAVRVEWPDGVEAQAVTTGPNLGDAQIVLSRVDGGVFDLTSLTIKLLANTAGTGGAVEIMPLLEGEDGLQDPVALDVSGNGGMSFSYDSSANNLGSTALLIGFDTYKITLWVDFALTALTVECHPAF